jgi:hypothetical protein
MYFYPRYRLRCGNSCSLPHIYECIARGLCGPDSGLKSLSKDCGCEVLRNFLAKKSDGALQKVIIEFLKEEGFYVENVLDHFDPKRISAKTIERILKAQGCIQGYYHSLAQRVLQIAFENGYWDLLTKISQKVPKAYEVQSRCPCSGEDEGTSISYEVVHPNVVTTAKSLLHLKLLQERFGPDCTE